MAAGAGEQGGVSPAGGARSEATVIRTVQSLGAVIAPTALISALLYYFGWAKAHAFARYFGLDVSIFGLSTQDFILQSIRAVVTPLGVLLISGLLLLWAHRTVVSGIERDPHRRIWPRSAATLAVIGAASFGLGLVLNADVYATLREAALVPLALMLGVALLSYAVLLERRRRHPAHAAPPVPTGSPGLNVILVSMLLAVGLVWTVAEYARLKGTEEAEFVHDQLRFQPGVAVYTAQRLHLGGAGVEETAFSEPESAFRFRYDGLKLLFHSHGTYFLVPESWSLEDGRTIVLREGDGQRLEFIRPAEG